MEFSLSRHIFRCPLALEWYPVRGRCAARAAVFGIGVPPATLVAVRRCGTAGASSVDGQRSLLKVTGRLRIAGWPAVAVHRKMPDGKSLGAGGGGTGGEVLMLTP